MKILVDASLVLELFLNRAGQVEQAEKFLDIQQNHFAEIYITDKCLNDITFYLGKPNLRIGHKTADFLSDFFDNRIITIEHDHIQKARTFPVHDFDHAVQLACAENVKLDAIVTAFPDNFVGSHIPVYTVNQFLHNCYSLERIHLETLFKANTNNRSDFDVSRFSGN